MKFNSYHQNVTKDQTTEKREQVVAERPLFNASFAIGDHLADLSDRAGRRDTAEVLHPRVFGMVAVGNGASRRPGVKTQVANLRNKECVPPSIVNLETGEWVNLKESDGNEGGGSTMWPPRQWYYAFEILVGWLAIVCFVLERAVRVICYLVI